MLNRINTILTYIWLTFLEIIFPPVCVACRRHLPSEEKDNLICQICAEKILVNSALFCPRCSRRLRGTALCHQKEKFILAAAESYSNPVIRELIHTLKYKKTEAAMKPLKLVVKQYCNNLIENCKLKIENFVIVPIPLHKSKKSQRGFNQSELIAEAIYQYWGVRRPLNDGRLILTIETKNLTRTKNTKSQTEVRDIEKRKENVIGCFKLKYPERIAGKNIILVDDVFTTGSTMREAVKILKDAGARKIIGFVIAKA